MAPATATARTTRTSFMGSLRQGGHSWSAPHHHPAERLEIFGAVALAPVLVTPLSRRSLTGPEPPTLLDPTVENHVHGLVGETCLRYVNRDGSVRETTTTREATTTSAGQRTSFATPSTGGPR